MTREERFISYLELMKKKKGKNGKDLETITSIHREFIKKGTICFKSIEKLRKIAGKAGYLADGAKVILNAID